jgi:nitrogenase iron protein NifH
MKKIAIYGKGGIGKSTTCSNISAALAASGLKVMQIGCDPKADSTRFLCGGKTPTTVLDCIRNNADYIELEDIIRVGYSNVLCVEAGGPTPGIGCAGRGIITAFETLEELNAYEIYKPDVVIYDVLGDVVCGGFAMPIRDGYADEVYVVTSGEMMAMYAASNIATAVRNFSNRNYARMGGIILNCRNVEDEVALVEKLCTEIESEIVGIVPRDSTIQDAEHLNKTVIEAFPESELAGVYRALAHRLVQE